MFRCGLICIVVILFFNSCSSETVELTKEERQWLEQNKTDIRMQFDSFFPPIEFAATSDGRFMGMSAEILDLIEKRLGISIQKSGASNWNAALRDLESGTCWFLPAIVSTPERREYAYITRPYITIPLAIIGNKDSNKITDLSQIHNKKIAVVSGYASEKYVRQHVSDDVEVIPLLNVEETVKAVSFGVVDYCVENLAVVSYEIDKLKLTNLKVLGDLDFTFPLSMGVSKKYPQLFSILQKSLDSISPEKYRELELKWITGKQEDYSDTVIFVIVISSVSIMLLSLIVYILRRRLKRTSDELHDIDSRLAMISSHIPDTVFFQIDVDLETGTRSFISVSDTVERQHGVSKASVLNDASIIYNQIHPEDSKKLFTAENRAIQEKALLKEELRFILPNGHERWTIVTAAPVEIQNRIVRWNGFETDITEHKKAAEKEALLQKQLHQSQKMEAIGQLAGGVAHDFNNALGGIFGVVELLMRADNINEKQKKYLNMVLESGIRASDLTQKLLSFSRKNVKTTKIIDCNQIVDDTVSILQHTIDRSIQIEIVKNAQKTAIFGDKSQLQNSLMNIGINASHAMPNGGVLTFTLKNIELDEIYCQASPFNLSPGSYLEISISDTGSGIPPEIQSDIFDPFFTTKGENKGTGLGLAVVYGVVQELKGAITLYSEVGVGTVFHIYLPLSDEIASKTKEETVVYEGSGTVLVIDDEELIRRTASSFLESIGYNVLVAENGDVGVKIFREQAENIDAIILDLIMPVLRGKDVLPLLRQISKNVPVVISSGFANEDQLEELKKHGISGFLQKPFHHSELAKMVTELTNRK